MNAVDAQSIETYPGAQSISRAIALLKCFNDTRPEWSLSELSDYLSLNKTTTHRMLAALEGEGLVERSGAGNYRLGAELIALGGCAMRSNELRNTARPFMETLTRETGEAVTLEILVRDQVQILDEVSSRDPLDSALNIGARLPIHATSTGKLLLAYQSGDAIDAMLERPLAALTPHTLVEPNALRAQLAAIREEGYATSTHELDIGFTAVAAPVYSQSGAVAAALSVGGPVLRLHGDAFPAVVAAVQVAARRISRRLGYQPG
ncbi:MAG: IclR family transcriptional regulator [Caldilineaceae bacterium]|nr:IclR family transcriptional regulator [Caldilineaceae bacterium]MCB9139482.1 IclR family transcriptional regulator [Caldilineaceae bacterium]